MTEGKTNVKIQTDLKESTMHALPRSADLSFSFFNDRHIVLQSL